LRLNRSAWPVPDSAPNGIPALGSGHPNHNSSELRNSRVDRCRSHSNALPRRSFCGLFAEQAIDQIVPIDAAGRASARIVRNATLKVYPGAPHGLADTHKEQLNADLLAFIRA
jgi:pimeloyl-ACP methyl ester carboxylesterase